MRFSLIASAAALAANTAYAQSDGSEDGANNGTEYGGTPTERDGNRTIHFVDAAKGGHFYQPNSIRAEVGDIVTFRFYPRNHSVIRAEYGFPCIPYEDSVRGGEGFDSGFFESESLSDEPGTWNLTINSTEPVFYYCGAPGSCLDWGMVGAINANASTPVATQIALAQSADYLLLPGEEVPPEALESASSIAEAATTATVIQADTPSDEASATPAPAAHSSSGLSGGAIAGIVIGGVAAIAILAALFFLLGRTKSMKKRMEEREKQDRHTSNMTQQSWMPQNQPYFNAGAPHQSAQLPPYGHPDHGFYEQKPPDETASLASGPMTPPLRGTSPPLPQFGGHQMPGFQSMPQHEPHQSGGYGFPTELQASQPMAAEIYTPDKDGTMPSGHPAYPKPE